MSTISDYSSIFKPVDSDVFVKKIIDACDDSCIPDIHVGYDYNQKIHQYRKCSRDSPYLYDKFKKYVNLSRANVHIKMLMLFKDGAVLSYNDVFKTVFSGTGKSLGHDKDSFLSLIPKKFIAFDHCGKYRRPYYKITSLGRKICEIAEANDIGYRVLRHVNAISSDDEGRFCTQMINIETNLETCEDLCSVSFIALLDEIFNEKSKMHETGSYVHWCNNLVKSLKNCKNFYDMFVCDEVKHWLAANTDNQAVKKFSAVLNKISKMYVKAA